MALTFDASEGDLKVFLEEADDQIELLQNDTIRLEKEYQDEALVQSIFRAAHTLKGSSGMIGHTRMANLTHAMESVLDLVRKANLTPTAEIVDTLLVALDALNILREEVVTREESDLDVDSVIAALRVIAEGATTEDGVEVASPVAADQASAETPASSEAWSELLDGEQRELLRQKCVERGCSAWLVSVQLDPDCAWLSVRAFQILTDLEGLGEIQQSWPSKAEIEQEKATASLRILLLCGEEPGTISGIVSAVEDVVACDVQLLPQPGDEVDAGAPKNEAPAVQDGRRTRAPVAPESERRVIDVGPEGRGKPPAQLLELAAQKIDKMSQNIRVDVERLDKLMNLIGELVIDRNRLHQIGLQLRSKLGVDESADALGEAAQHVARITDELQDEVMRIRMLPIENVFNKFPRMVRGLTQKLGKKIDLVIEGKETELDRSVIEKIDDPIIHLLRNAVDHGIELPEERRAAGKPEAGVIKLSAWHEENHIVIAVEDDGRGIDPEKLKASAVRKGIISSEAAERMDDRSSIDLIFAPGFSTAAETTDVSGRGVGMDIVRTNIEKLNGFVSVETEVGKGTRFVVRLPLTLAIIRALLVNAGGQKFAIPMTTVVETLRLDPRRLQHLQTAKAIQLRGRVLPLVALRDVLAPSLMLHLSGRDDPALAADLGAGARKDKMFVVAVRVGDRQMGVEVDSFIGQTDIVIKPLSGFLGDVKGVAGVTILGDGRLAIICDMPFLMTRAVQEQMLV